MYDGLCTYCSVGISDLKPLTGTSADQLPHGKNRLELWLRTKVAVFKAIIMTIEPKPAGPTFARCALNAGPNGLPMDTNIYKLTRKRYSIGLADSAARGIVAS